MITQWLFISIESNKSIDLSSRKSIIDLSFLISSTFSKFETKSARSKPLVSTTDPDDKYIQDILVNFILQKLLRNPLNSLTNPWYHSENSDKSLADTVNLSDENFLISTVLKRHDPSGIIFLGVL